MQRDGANESLWQQNMPPYTSKHTSIPAQQYDVVIAGGGVTGISTALQLQKQGKKVLVLEMHSLCFGTTGGTTSHLNTFFDTDYDTIESDFGEEGAQLIASATSKALDLYRQNIEQYKIDCGYAVKDAYVFAEDEKQVKQLDKMLTAAKKAGADVAWTDRIPIQRDFLKAIVYHDNAQVHSSKYVYALAEAFEKGGGVIVQDCKVTKLTEHEGQVLIETSKQPVTASYFIWATHIPPGINLLHFRCAPYRSYAIAVTLKKGDYPESLIYDMQDPYHYYRTQEVDGKKYLIAGGEDHKTGHEQNTESCFNNLEAHVRSIYEVEEVAFRWSSQYFEPADGLAYIGLLPGSSGNVLVATGYSGNGMTYSHIAATLLTDLVLQKENAFAALFSPNRIKPIAGFTEFVKENVDVVKEFVGKRLSAEKIEELSELAHGEGRVVKYEGEKLAIYKDENGGIHALNPVCTHAKCIVDWNSSEKSWDCPCHGGRFSIDGKVLTGPPRSNLQKVELEQLVEKGG
jgi:glycine/D-amino acid oxidase-like deaminating enzyme/nitrite reductase/ring-hydroxylating ferredoxin subunit